MVVTWRSIVCFFPELIFQLQNPFNGPAQWLQFVVDYFSGNY
jgi:hypothetical protein